MLAMMEAHLLAAAVFVLPVALYWVRGSYARALVLIGCSVLPWLSFGRDQWQLLGQYLVVAHGGVLLGVLGVRRWPFGWTVAALTGIAFAFASSMMLSHWEYSQRAASANFLSRAAELQKVEEETGNAWPGAAAEMLRTLNTHFESIVFGSVFNAAMLASVVLVSLFVALSPRGGGLRGSLRQMRPPDVLVWPLILAAFAGLADMRWEEPALRVFSWNTLIALAAVYWVNGFSILLHALHVFTLAPVLKMILLVLVALFYMQLQPLFWAVGLFDTWFEFRERFNRQTQLRPPNDDINGA